MLQSQFPGIRRRKILSGLNQNVRIKGKSICQSLPYHYHQEIVFACFWIVPNAQSLVVYLWLLVCRLFFLDQFSLYNQLKELEGIWSSAKDLRGMDIYLFFSFRWEFAKNIMVCLPFLARRILKFWLIHSSPRPLDFAPAIPATKTILWSKIVSWKRIQSGYGSVRSYAYNERSTYHSNRRIHNVAMHWTDFEKFVQSVRPRKTLLTRVFALLELVVQGEGWVIEYQELWICEHLWVSYWTDIQLWIKEPLRPPPSVNSIHLKPPEASLQISSRGYRILNCREPFTKDLSH